MRIFNHTGHKELWDWVSKYPEQDKSNWPGWARNGGTVDEVFADCFACEYDTVDACSDVCPLIWPDIVKGKAQDCLGSLFGKFSAEYSLKKKSKLAEKIRDLKVREGVKTI